MILEVDNIRKEYGNFCLACSFSVEENRITGLIGANGAGKSTLFKAILDLISIDEGYIRIFGKEHNRLTAADKEKTGVVMGKSSPFGMLTVKKILPVLNSMYHDFDREEFTGKCREYNLPFNVKIKDFSTGEMAKLNILIATCHNADLLLLDEPTAGLDVLAREQIMDMLRRYMEKEGRSIIISSHISGDLENFCDDVYMINKGRLVFHEDMDVLLDEYGVLKIDERAYGDVDKSHIVYACKSDYGYICLTDARQFYLENYKDIVVEKNGIDEFMKIAGKGIKL